MRIVVAAAAVLLLSACGGGGAEQPVPSSPSPAPSSSQPSTPASTPDPDPSTSRTTAEPVAAVASIEEAVERTGCTGYALADQAAPFSAEYGTCRWKGQRLQLYGFDSEGDRAKFFEATAAFGVVESQVAVCGLVVASAETQKATRQLRSVLGCEA